MSNEGRPSYKDPVKSHRPDLPVSGPGECLTRCTGEGRVDE